jgi:hypothetical protein
MAHKETKDGVTTVTDFKGNTVKYGKVEADKTPKSTYDKAMGKMNQNK